MSFANRRAKIQHFYDICKFLLEFLRKNLHISFFFCNFVAGFVRVHKTAECK